MSHPHAHALKWIMCTAGHGHGLMAPAGENVVSCLVRNEDGTVCGQPVQVVTKAEIDARRAQAAR